MLSTQPDVKGEISKTNGHPRSVTQNLDKLKLLEKYCNCYQLCNLIEVKVKIVLVGDPLYP